jgi:hypothetical protein
MIPALVALAATAAVQADAPAPPGTELWRGARLGMTPAQVQAAFPKAHPVVDGESLLDDAKQLFILPGERLPTGDTATASFYFRGDSLIEVKLVADVPQGRTDANIGRAEAISNSLVSAYGKPTNCGPRQGLLAYECDWISRGLSITVSYMDVAGQSPLLETAIRGIVNPDAPVARALAPKPGTAASRATHEPSAR